MKKILFMISTALVAVVFGIASLPRKTEARILPVDQLGHYTVSYAGGTATGTGAQKRTSINQMDQEGFYVNNVTAQPTSTTTATATCSGTITVSFTWVPGTEELLPPSVLILEKESITSWSGSGVASYADGLDGSGNQNQYTPPPASLLIGGQEAKHEYIKRDNPGEYFELQINPSVSNAQLTYQYAGGVTSVSASVRVKFSPHIARVNLSGTYWENPHRQASIGQRIESTVQIDGYPGHANDTWNWTPSQGAFRHYQIGANEATSSLDVSFATNQQALNCSFATLGTVTITCEMQLGTWDNLTITVVGRFNSNEPIFVAPFQSMGSEVLHQLPVATGMRLWGITAPNASSCGQLVWAYVQDDPLRPGGAVKFVDLVISKKSMYDTASADPYEEEKTMAGGPYLAPPGFSSAYTENVGVTDSEEMGYLWRSYNANWSFPSDATVVEDEAHYATYMFFCAPDGEWVPIRRLIWSRHGEVHRNTANDAWPAVNDTSVVGSWEPEYVHPIWNAKL